jgi:tRNA threonylcarbamoyladenosine biosynthesis protein TsaB
MRLVLAVETSSANHSVALGTPAGVQVSRAIRRQDPSFQGVGPIVASALAEAGGRFADIDRIGVDVGPGNLASVRSGVAYANGLAFSLGLPVLWANALELMAIEVAGSDPGPVLCLRNAGGGNVYAGLFRDGATVGMRHGPLERTVASMGGGLVELSVAGTFRQDVLGMLPHSLVKDTGIDVPDVLTLYRVLAAAPDGAPRSGVAATPLNEMSAVFDAVD